MTGPRGIPLALCTVGLCWLTARIGRWAFGRAEGFYAGLALATCIGLWLFTRILIPDVILTGNDRFSVVGVPTRAGRNRNAPACLVRSVRGCYRNRTALKGLIAAVFPVGAAVIYLVITGQLREPRTWQRIRPFTGSPIALLIAAPWHVLATVRNPPYFDLTHESEPGQYHGFFWFYFLNEHVFRFLNMRWPRDYNTVPRSLFWLLPSALVFPVEAFLPGDFKLSYRPSTAPGACD